MLKMLADRLLKTSFVIITLAALAANALAAPNPRAYGVGHPFELQDLPFGDFRDRLGSLPEPARNKAMAWLHRFSFTEQDLEYLRIDDAGGVFYADTYLPEDTGTEESGNGEPAKPEAAPGPGEVFSLHSRPGASNILYLDFDGHLIPASTAWTDIDLHAKPYDLDGNPGTFSDAELANIAEIWRRIAEDYASFEVDITTQVPATFGPTVGRILITTDTDAYGNAMPAQGAGGVAYVGVWGYSSYSSKYSPALVYYNNLGNGRADYVSEAATHEAGHNLSLSHDATSDSSYYGGHGSGYVSWGPLMGTGYNRHVSQWSKGEYTDASQQQDDVSIIAGKLAYRGDDHGDLFANATRIISDTAGNVSATTPQDAPDNLESDNKGVIETETDMDVFYFDTTGGAVSLTVTPAWQQRYTRGGNLDIHAALHDINGTLLLEDDPQSDTNSTLNASLPAGRYYLAIQGTGSSASPYTDYGSLGQYFISGMLPALSNPVTVSANYYNTCVLEDSSVMCSGRDSFGVTTVPVLSNPVAVSVGTYHACALDDSGVVCWGSNDSGQATVPTLIDPVAVSAGGRHTCALDDQGVVCWGDNSVGQSTVPTLSNPMEVSAGDNHTCALDLSGVVCWGFNDAGQTTIPGVDKDSDGTPDSNDAFPLDPTEIVDTDADGIGNNADLDDDNDGMTDSYEILNNFNPLNAADAALDSDGDSYSNLSEYRAGTDPLDPDSVPKPKLMPWLPLLLGQ
jgi:hypothetical protein